MQNDNASIHQSIIRKAVVRVYLKEYHGFTPSIEDIVNLCTPTEIDAITNNMEYALGILGNLILMVDSGLI